MEHWQTFGSVTERLSLLKCKISSASPSSSGLVCSRNSLKKHESGIEINQEINKIGILKDDLKRYDLSFKIPLFSTMEKLVEEDEDEAEEKEEAKEGEEYIGPIESTDF